MTKFLKKSELSSGWYEVDATNVVVGRLIPCGTSLAEKRHEAKFDKTAMIEQEIAEEMTSLPDLPSEAKSDDEISPDQSS